MSPDEKAIRDLLKGCGAMFRRKTGKGRECWTLPNGATFFLTVNSGDYRAHKNNLADLRRMLGKIEPEKIVAAANVSAEKEAATARTAARVAALQIPITVEPVSFAKFNEPAQTITAPDRRIEAPTPQEEQQTMGVIQMKPKQEPPTTLGTRWTEAQDRALLECQDAGMSFDETVRYMQDVRPGCTVAAAKQRVIHVRSKQSAAPVLPPAVNTAPPPIAAAPAPMPPLPRLEADLVRVVFEFGDKKRVVYVDQETAQSMLSEAARLS